MKNKYLTLACPQASSTRASGPLRKKHLMSSAALAGLVLALAPAAQAANVIWEAPTSVYTLGDATVLTDADGTLVTAETFGSIDTSYTVNGVLFTDAGFGAYGFTKDSSGTMSEHQTYDYGGTAISSAFTNLLDGFAHMNGTTGSKTITLDGLESGKSYIAQFFIGDEREATSGDITVGRFIDGNYSITGGANTSAKAFIMPMHSFVGTWVADATTQDFTITNTDSTKTLNVILNAAQWRQVPEPSSMGLLALGGLGLLFNRRRRRA